MRFLLNSVFITIVSLIVAVGVAYGMSKINSKITPPNSNAHQDKDTGSNSGAAKPFDKDSIKAVDGGVKGGNPDVVKEGRLPTSEGKPINTNPEVFSYKLNQNISFESPTEAGSIKVENDPGNNDAMQLCIYLNDTQRLVYASPMLNPNQHIDSDKLLARLNKGEYDATAVIGVYDKLSHAIKTTIYNDVKLIVNDTWLNSMFG